MADIALLTGGGDRPYALGLTQSLTANGTQVDFVGSDFLKCAELIEDPRVRFLNLRGDVSPDAPYLKKLQRVIRYYFRLVKYAASSRAPVFHVLWNNKVEWMDRTLLMLYYRSLGKKIVFTAHNVNAGRRDGRDSWWNRLTLRCQYRLSDHVFVHTGLMKSQLVQEFGVPAQKVSVIPFGLNTTVPVTNLTMSGARVRLGLPEASPILLFFGNIAPYKGVEYLIECLPLVHRVVPQVRVVIAGRPKGEDVYWQRVERRINDLGLSDSVIRRIEYVADADIETYFKAADVLVLPYAEIFQSGVLFLGYSFGLPAIATDVGSLIEDVVEGETGYVARPRSAASLAAAVQRFLASDLYANRSSQRERIQQWARQRYSWQTVAATTCAVYQDVLMRV